MDRLDAIRLFVRVVDRSSFAAAAREAGIGQPAVSKQMAALEHYFGAQLIRRTSRSMTLTTEGQALYDAGVRLVGDFDDITAAIGRGQAQVAGLVRMTVAPMFGRLYVVPVLPAFFVRFPDVSVDLTATERTVNLVEEGYDLVLRNGAPADSALIARQVAASRFVFVATPSYLARWGTPRHLHDLAGHTGVLFAPSHAVRPWQFRVGAAAVTHMPHGPFRSADVEQIRAAVLADIGLAQVPAWAVAAELAAGALVEVMPDLAPPPLGIHAIHPAGRRLPSKVRVLIEHLEASFAQQRSTAFL
jgi:DNA-binding transcriptional LysR family regulator